MVQEISKNNFDTEKKNSWVLKASIFATGLAGIVAEYVMSTLASYLLGNTVIQWTLTLSVMMFAMGVGSRISKNINRNLLDVFIIVEFSLSLICGISAIGVYFLSIYIPNIAFLIYFISFSIGFLIGLEIPLVTRLNNLFEELRVNISSVMEKDYYGSLLGGIFFAFFALPKLGLTYTPILLGAVNFLVALLLVYKFYKYLGNKKLILFSASAIPLILILLAVFAKPVVLFGEQQKYIDHIIYEEQSQYQKIVITHWKDHHWLYLNGNEQFSSYDEEKYHEPLIHPAMQIYGHPQNILVLGGGDGLAVREILKYHSVKKVEVVDLDPAITNLGKTYPIFRELNNNSLNNPIVKIINKDAYIFLKESKEIYDVIIIDLPDPKSITLARLYTRQFYRLASTHLSKNGVIATQATSPFFSKKAFLSIQKSMEAVGFPVVSYHNHIPTLGEWGFVLAFKSNNVSSTALKDRLKSINFSNVKTRYIDREIMAAMMTFGKDFFKEYDIIKINDEIDLALYQYYRKGDWEIY